jgi:hypothetical protein
LKKAIKSKLFLKEKYNSDGTFDRVKARLVAGGHLQDRRLYDDVSSPTAATSSLLIVAALAAEQRRQVCTVDIKGAYLNAKMQKPVHMWLDANLSELAGELQPGFNRYKSADGRVLVQLDRALYGTIEAGQLWYEHIKSTLNTAGYVSNEYDACVFNKTVNGKQISVVLYVDDLFVTCEDSNLIEELLQVLRSTYKTITVKNGKTHSYLGLTFDYTVEGECAVSMAGFVNDLLHDAGVPENSSAPTPASNNLFTIRENCKKLDQSKSEIFHSLTAKILYLAKRVRPDLLVAVSFLSTRTKEPDEDDWIKLTRALRYVNSSKELFLRLKPRKNFLLASIDASFGIHFDYKSHTGVCIFVGFGVIFAKSTKQKLNSKSSTEAELIAASDGAAYVIGIRNFMIS